MSIFGFWKNIRIESTKMMVTIISIVLIMLVVGGIFFYNQQLRNLYYYYGKILQSISAHEVIVSEAEIVQLYHSAQQITISPYFRQKSGYFTESAEIRDTPELRKYLQQIVNVQRFYDVAVYSPTGKLISYSTSGLLTDSLTQSQIELISDRTREFHLDYLNFKPIGNTLNQYVSFVFKLFDKEEFLVGYMIFSLSLGNSIFNSILTWPIAETKGQFLFCKKIGNLISVWGIREGKIVKINDYNYATAGEIVHNISLGKTGTMRGSFLDSDDVMVNVQKIGNTDFLLLTTINTSEIKKNIPSVLALLIGYVLSIFLIISIITYSFYNNYKKKQYLDAINEERMLRIQQEKYRLLIDNMNEGLLVTDLDDRIMFVNKQTFNIYGYTEDEMIGQIGYELLEVVPYKDFVQSRREMRMSGLGECYDVVALRKDGNKIWTRINAAPVYDETQNVVGTIGVISDITARKLAEDELYKKDQILTSILQTQQEFICRMLPDTTLTFVNKAYCDFFKKTEEELIGSSFLQFVPEQFRTEELLIINSLNSNKRSVTTNSQVKDLDGGVHVMEWTDTALFDNDMNVVEIQSVGHDITEKVKTQHKLSEALKQVKNYSMHLQNVREEEKISIAREIHDDLGQILIALKIDNGIVKLNLKREGKLFDKMKVVSLIEKQTGIIDKSIVAARRIMNGLRPAKLELLGLIGAVNDYLSEYSQRYQIEGNFSANIEEIKLEPDKSLAVYRIIQEALTNVIKHASATTVNINIELNSVDEFVVVNIEDNGVGFDTSAPKKTDSYGVLGMNERALLLNGEIQILSFPGQGTNVVLKFPYQVN